MASFSIRDVSTASADALAREAGVHPITARCLIARGADDKAAAHGFLNPRLSGLRPPTGLADLSRAVERIAGAITGGELVGVFGDYDVDGVTTAALLATTIEALGGRALPRVARRSAGYGFGVADAEFFSDSGCHLIITGDCGTSDLDAIETAKSHGLEVIVIDHHTVPSDPAAHPSLALINPFRSDSTFEFTGFASVGLAFYVMQTVRTALRKSGHFLGTAASGGAARPEPDLCDWLDLVALGSVADLVPLTFENRILTARGLEILNRRGRPGLVELARSAGIEDDAPIGAREIGWKLAPRLNAPGRLGDAEPALQLLLARTPERARELAATLEQLNDDRREAQDVAYAEALTMIEENPPGPCAVVAGVGWLPGVVGIVAARLVDLLERPVFAIAIDESGVARGSARTYGGCNVYNALASCRDLVGRFGGHAAAAGLTMKVDDIDALRAGLEAAVASQRIGSADESSLGDSEVAVSDLVAAGGKPSTLVQELEALRPFGKGNPELRLVVRGATVLEARNVGKDRSHLKLVVRDGEEESGAGGGTVEIGAIGFGLGESRPEVGETVDLLCSPLLNHWRGTTRVELQIHAIAPSTAAPELASELAPELAPELVSGREAGVDGQTGVTDMTTIESGVTLDSSETGVGVTL